MSACTPVGAAVSPRAPCGDTAFALSLLLRAADGQAFPQECFRGDFFEEVPGRIYVATYPGSKLALRLAPGLLDI